MCQYLFTKGQTALGCPASTKGQRCSLWVEEWRSMKNVGMLVLPQEGPSVTPRHTSSSVNSIGSLEGCAYLSQQQRSDHHNGATVGCLWNDTQQVGPLFFSSLCSVTGWSCEAGTFHNHGHKSIRFWDLRSFRTFSHISAPTLWSWMTRWKASLPSSCSLLFLSDQLLLILQNQVQVAPLRKLPPLTITLGGLNTSSLSLPPGLGCTSVTGLTWAQTEQTPWGWWLWLTHAQHQARQALSGPVAFPHPTPYCTATWLSRAVSCPNRRHVLLRKVSY
jgi:hypothetical protein